MKQLGKQLLIACCLLGALFLSACATGSGGHGGVAQGRDYFPGGSPDYAWGISQTKEDFVNVEQAQSYSGLYSRQRTWQNITVSSRASATILGLNAYYPLHVRWKLKDGREFMLENIDIAAIMREYFKSHDIQLQWQRERRPMDSVGDYGPLLTHEVKDDTVRIKWVISTNHTPVDKRLTTSKAATKWQITDEEHLVTTLQGVPTHDIDFNNWYEVRK
ncbi:MAG: hypothetical protein FD135_3498 [Comamonadaceae bacterium]|nr:MAG: hypothetical protein FD135_3498 [Comamonadaceae bacterium]